MAEKQDISCEDMLAFSFQLGKIIRDMRHVNLPNEFAERKREAIITALQNVCKEIDDSFA